MTFPSIEAGASRRLSSRGTCASAPPGIGSWRRRWRRDAFVKNSSIVSTCWWCACRRCASDSGPDILDGLRGKVFTPIFTTKGTGTGLGLSISDAIIRRYGGNVTPESESGRRIELRAWLLGEPEIGDADTALAEQLRLTGIRRDMA